MAGKAQGVSLLPYPEHHIGDPNWEAQRGDANLAGDPFAFLKLDVICYDDMGKQGLDLTDCQEPSWTEGKE
jgi:hypothetical protein